MMQLALRLARKGEGKVSPNPLVGAVIVKDGKIVGSGYHKRFGEPHAEINALNEAGEKAGGGTLYVNLEPHSFMGKTPPCTEAIIKAGIKKVLCSIIDPNPQVNGEGVKKLKSSGIQVEVGLLSQEAERLNEVYLKYITTRIPFVILKVAQTLDGKIATLNGDSKWITSETSREFVHKLRSRVDAVLVGSKTVIRDNPELTIHKIKGENPKRIILTTSGQLPPDSRILKNNKDNKTIVVTSKFTSRLKSYPAEIWEVKRDRDGEIELKEFLRKASQEGIVSILVEGGKEIFTSFIRNKLVDKVYYFLAPKILGKGLETFGDLGVNRIKDSLNLKDVEIKRFSDDLLLIGYPEWRN
ncbi:MAG: bifunctional diaminohydroxyphosphoribosylaminopyrimidine deaminase/5-amino-6-(5-phosphoribosylamino)uracil reductase RibD [candidate division Zixibacteria bacterium]|nr:bifunctional diaminohydroxyphosphoribosylaminopyrimidine deaminase/5-amino-6-(5-phosphoribosylamino)uracil reductase RibD [candidate division Zixibacteria bacterium]